MADLSKLKTPSWYVSIAALVLAVIAYFNNMRFEAVENRVKKMETVVSIHDTAFQHLLKTGE